MTNQEIQAVEDKYYAPFGRKMTKAQRAANAALPWNPWKIGTETENWFRAIQWEGKESLKKQLKKADFNLPLLVVHLESMAKALKDVE